MSTLKFLKPSLFTKCLQSWQCCDGVGVWPWQRRLCYGKWPTVRWVWQQLQERLVAERRINWVFLRWFVLCLWIFFLTRALHPNKNWRKWEKFEREGILSHINSTLKNSSNFYQKKKKRIHLMLPPRDFFFSSSLDFTLNSMIFLVPIGKELWSKLSNPL